MNWKWLRCFCCRAASLPLLVALAYLAPAATAWAQDGAAAKSPAAQAAPKPDSTNPAQENPTIHHNLQRSISDDSRNGLRFERPIRV